LDEEEIVISLDNVRSFIFKRELGISTERDRVDSDPSTRLSNTERTRWKERITHFLDIEEKKLSIIQAGDSSDDLLGGSDVDLEVETEAEAVKENDEFAIISEANNEG
jgi:hypothetical protein